MIEQPARVEQFQQEIDAMQLRDPAVTRERNLLRLGGILMVVGIVVAAGAYVLDRSANVNSGQAQQLDALSLGLLGVVITVVGGAMFLRYSLGQFLRFWLARLSYEQQAAADRLSGGPAPIPNPAAAPPKVAPAIKR
jgi:hypothetical protein